MSLKNHFVVYTDGACSGNPGPGGYGVVIFNPLDQRVVELGGAEPHTTNNRMEMCAVLEALKWIDDKASNKILIYTDSTYVINGMTKWVFGWKKRNWKNSEGKEVLNLDLWKDLEHQRQKFKELLSWEYVPGHAGVAGNERCDEIAVKFSQNQSVKLYTGGVSDYMFDILKAPELKNSEKAKLKRSSSSKKAFSYVSSIEGAVEVHKTWPECERRVKGVKALFKKVFSQSEEDELVQKWSK